MGDGEVRDGVPLTNLDQPLFDGAQATKRDLVDYLDAVRGCIIPELRDRPLSVIRVMMPSARLCAEEATVGRAAMTAIPTIFSRHPELFILSSSP